jgi:hypothetical protein
MPNYSIVVQRTLRCCAWLGIAGAESKLPSIRSRSNAYEEDHVLDVAHARHQIDAQQIGATRARICRGLPASRVQIIEGELKGCAHIVDGGRACPAEDVGGPFGYQQFLDTLAEHPENEEANDCRRWAGNDFNAELFDRRAANAALLRMAWNRWGRK